MLFLKKHVKDLIYILCFIVLFSLSITLFCIKGNGNNAYWQQVLSIRIDGATSTSSDIEYTIVSKKDYDTCMEKYQNEDKIALNFKTKSIYVKFSNDTIYIKCYTYGGNLYEKEHPRIDLVNVDYV